MANANDPSAQPGVVLRLTQYVVINTDITTAQTILTNTNATACVITAVIVRNPSVSLASGSTTTLATTTGTYVTTSAATDSLAAGHVAQIPTPVSTSSTQNAVLNQGDILTLTLAAGTGTSGSVAYVDVLGYLV